MFATKTAFDVGVYSCVLFYLSGVSEYFYFPVIQVPTLNLWITRLNEEVDFLLGAHIQLCKRFKN